MVVFLLLRVEKQGSMMQENKCRVFLGIPVPQPIYVKLKKLLCAHQHRFSAGHWILPENAHITIHFFGDIDHQQLDELWKNIKNKINNHVKSFSINVEKIAAFPYKNSNLIAAYINENSEIQKLFSLMNNIHVDSEMLNKTFIPHITLYRNKNDIPATLPEILVKDCEFIVDKLVLYESLLIDDKRIYRQLYSARLKKD